jgi:hypothetical protein
VIEEIAGLKSLCDYDATRGRFLWNVCEMMKELDLPWTKLKGKR